MASSRETKMKWPYSGTPLIRTPLGQKKVPILEIFRGQELFIGGKKRCPYQRGVLVSGVPLESGVYTLRVESKLVADVSGTVEIEPIAADSDPGSVHTDLHEAIRETNSSYEPHFSVLTPPFLICNNIGTSELLNTEAPHSDKP